jgi:hypothetical protein
LHNCTDLGESFSELLPHASDLVVTENTYTVRDSTNADRHPLSSSPAHPPSTLPVAAMEEVRGGSIEYADLG